MIIEGAILQPECIFLQTDYTNSAGRNATDWIAFIPHLHLELDLMCYLPHDDRDMITLTLLTATTQSNVNEK